MVLIIHFEAVIHRLTLCAFILVVLIGDFCLWSLHYLDWFWKWGHCVRPSFIFINRRPLIVPRKKNTPSYCVFVYVYRKEIMARPLKLATVCTSMMNSHSGSSVFISKLNLFACQQNSTRNCSSQNVYKIDHSGFVNGLGPDPPRNDQLGIRDKIVNRNPRVLEYLNVTRRQEGWRFQAPRRNYTNKLVLEMTGRNVQAYIQHYNGEKVCLRACF